MKASLSWVVVQILSDLRLSALAMSASVPGICADHDHFSPFLDEAAAALPLARF